MRDLAKRDDWRGPRTMHGIQARSISARLSILSRCLNSIVPASARNLHKEAVGKNGFDGYGVIEVMYLPLLSRPVGRSASSKLVVA